MSTAIISAVVGRGEPGLSLSEEELYAIVAEALDQIATGQRVLAIVPDKTRDDNTYLLFPFAAQILAQKNIAQLDVLIAQGTHAPMNAAEKDEKIGIGRAEIPGLGRIL